MKNKDKEKEKSDKRMLQIYEQNKAGELFWRNIQDDDAGRCEERMRQEDKQDDDAER